MKYELSGAHRIVFNNSLWTDLHYGDQDPANYNTHPSPDAGGNVKLLTTAGAELDRQTSQSLEWIVLRSSAHPATLGAVTYWCGDPVFHTGVRIVVPGNGASK